MRAVTLKTPGLHIDWIESGGHLFAKIVHTGSGLVVRSFNSHPIEGGKHKFAAQVDEALKGIDWTRRAKTISADKEAWDAIWSINHRPPHSACGYHADV